MSSRQSLASTHLHSALFHSTRPSHPALGRGSVVLMLHLFVDLSELFLGIWL